MIVIQIRSICCINSYFQRFSTPREIWDVVGPLYVRPKVLQEEVLSLPGFVKKDAGTPGLWDPDYTTAADIFKILQQQMPRATESTAYDDQEYFLKDETTACSFEPSKSAPVVLPKAEQSATDSSLIKVEDLAVAETADAAMEDIINDDDDDEKPVVIKSESDSQVTISRGRQSPWLTVLDARICRLLREEFHVPVVR